VSSVFAESLSTTAASQSQENLASRTPNITIFLMLVEGIIVYEYLSEPLIVTGVFDFCDNNILSIVL
jgi:hypothetical protein